MRAKYSECGKEMFHYVSITWSSSNVSSLGNFNDDSNVKIDYFVAVNGTSPLSELFLVWKSNKNHC